jgi:hypothetical protein
MADFPNYYKVRGLLAPTNSARTRDATRFQQECAQVLKNQDGEAVTLSSYQGKNTLVLFFYPKAATPGCTAEAVSFKNAYSRFTNSGAVVRAVRILVRLLVSGDRTMRQAQTSPYVHAGVWDFWRYTRREQGL